MDKSTESPDEDTLSLKSNGMTVTNGVMKETPSIMQSLRKTIRKGSKVISKADRAGHESGSQPPPSPSLSAGSPVKSPLKRIESLFQKKPEDEGQQKVKPVKRVKTDPNMSVSYDSFVRGPLTRSLTFRSKKARNNASKELKTEGSLEEKEEKEEEVLVEVEETYTLPEIPHTPLSVMQISQLIETGVLEEAHLNLLALRLEFQQELERCGEDSPVELVKKEKDLNLLYRDLRNKISAIVRDSNALLSSNKELLLPLARIIQEEEKRAEEPGGLQDSWMEAWREMVGEGVKLRVESVHLESREQTPSWLANHLGQLGTAIVEDLKNVGRQLRWSYPPSFNVFSTYVRSYHRGVGMHLKKLEPHATELRELYSLLDWIINTYKSQSIMGSLSLQPDMKDESTELQLEENFLKQLKEKYCSKVKEDMRSYLDGVIKLENEEFWKERKDPEKEEDFLISQIYMDIWKGVESNVQISRTIDAQLEQKVTSSCLEELKQFPKKFEAEFNRHCSSLKPQPLWTQYQITYINTFTLLQEHMEGYQAACPDEVERFRREGKWLIVRLLQGLEDQFKDEVKPYLRRMMTRKWMTDDADFKQLYDQTRKLSEHCAVMRPPHVQEFASRLHYHVVKEYIGQLMKNNYSCKNRKHENAAAKISEQWNKLSSEFVDMESSHEWLYPVGDELSNIIGQKNKSDIKDHVEPLMKDYPDFSRNHLVAVLHFRGLMRGREHHLILQRFKEVKKNLSSSSGGDKTKVLFGDMEVTVNTDCLSNLPFSCFSFLLPNN
ncbi:exocyst complex component 3-like protein 4 [Trachinotus anak]|uniref:exocyst complex component 3-like protein 4 n=1 Tax=Trachinotus anak TaxID=443729 RepID=UPI0039F1CE4F